MFEVHIKSAAPPPKAPESHRDVVRDFSRKSRTRMQKLLCSIPDRHVAAGMLFVTLTYPGEWAGDWRRWKRDLDVFSHRVARKFPRCSWVWKLEPQKRGAPHFHLVVIGVPFIAREWVANAWYEVVGSNDARHARAGTQVAAVRSPRGLVAYASKYAAKGVSLPSSWEGGVGRFWGVFRREGLGVSLDWLPVTEEQAEALIEWMTEAISARGGRSPDAVPSWWLRNLWMPLPADLAGLAIDWALKVHPGTPAISFA